MIMMAGMESRIWQAWFRLVSAHKWMPLAHINDYPLLLLKKQINSLLVVLASCGIQRYKRWENARLSVDCWCSWQLIKQLLVLWGLLLIRLIWLLGKYVFDTMGKYGMNKLHSSVSVNNRPLYGFGKYHSNQRWRKFENDVTTTHHKTTNGKS